MEDDDSLSDPSMLRWIYPPVFPNIAGWKIPMFNREYIFNPGSFSIAMFVYQRPILPSAHDLRNGRHPIFQEAIQATGWPLGWKGKS